MDTHVVLPQIEENINIHFENKELTTIKENRTTEKICKYIVQLIVAQNKSKILAI
jgi:hypothetical protein